MIKVREDPDVHHNGDLTVVNRNDVTSDKMDMLKNKIRSQRQISDTRRTFNCNQRLATQAHTTVATFTDSYNTTAASACLQATPPQVGTTSRWGDPKLSTLSLNVCTERGPSKTRKFRIVDITAGSPSVSSRLPCRSQRRCLKENVAVND